MTATQLLAVRSLETNFGSVDQPNYPPIDRVYRYSLEYAERLAGVDEDELNQVYDALYKIQKFIRAWIDESITNFDCALPENLGAVVEELWEIHDNRPHGVHFYSRPLMSALDVIKYACADDHESTEVSTSGPPWTILGFHVTSSPANRLADALVKTQMRVNDIENARAFLREATT